MQGLGYGTVKRGNERGCVPEDERIERRRMHRWDGPCMQGRASKSRDVNDVVPSWRWARTVG